MGNTPRARLAAVDAGTANLRTGFRADSSATVREVMLHNGLLYIVGGFRYVNGIPRNRIGAVDPTSGAVDPGFSPSTDDIAYAGAIDPTRNRLVVAGRFHHVNGNDQQYLGAVRLDNGAFVNWRPVPHCQDTGNPCVPVRPSGRRRPVLRRGGWPGRTGHGVACRVCGPCVEPVRRRGPPDRGGGGGLGLRGRPLQPAIRPDGHDAGRPQQHGQGHGGVERLQPAGRWARRRVGDPRHRWLSVGRRIVHARRREQPSEIRPPRLRGGGHPEPQPTHRPEGDDRHRRSGRPGVEPVDRRLRCRALPGAAGGAAGRHSGCDRL